MSMISKGKYVVGVLVVSTALLVAGFVYYYQDAGYSFSIQGEEVPEEDFRSVLQYYLDQPDMEERYAIEVTKSLFLENHTFKEVFSERNIDISAVLEEESSNSASVRERLVKENKIMADALRDEAHINSRSGHIIDVRIANPRSADARELDVVSARKLLEYRNELLSGEDFDDVRERVENDPVFSEYDSVNASASSFSDVTLSRPIIFGESAENALFNTDAGDVSNIFFMEDDNNVIYGIVHITERVDGGHDSYRHWLANMVSNTEYEFNYN